MSRGDKVKLRACLLENLGVGRLFPTCVGIGKAAHMCVVDTTIDGKGIRFSVFVSNVLLDCGCIKFGCGERLTRSASLFRAILHLLLTLGYLA